MHLAIVQGWQPSKDDLERERNMTCVLLDYHHEPDCEKKRELWRRYQELHQQRSPEYVEYLERSRGLYRGTNQNHKT